MSAGDVTEITCDACTSASDWVHRRCHHSMVLKAGTYEAQRDSARKRIKQLERRVAELEQQLASEEQP